MKTTGWTFFTNHSHVLFNIYVHPDLPMRDIALKVGITERAVQNIVRDLIEAHIISTEKVGRNNKYRVHSRAPLRHPIESHRTVLDLLNFINTPQGGTDVPS